MDRMVVLHFHMPAIPIHIPAGAHSPKKLNEAPAEFPAAAVVVYCNWCFSSRCLLAACRDHHGLTEGQ